MSMPFPGMNPYLEHPVLWEGVHARLIVAIANQLQPQSDPRYVTSIEERVFIEGPQRRIPDVWIQRSAVLLESERIVTAADTDADVAVVLEVEELEIRESRVEILDAYNEMKLVGIVEVLSPSNKRAGPGQESYWAKQEEVLSREFHLVEIDIQRGGEHVLAVPDWRLNELRPFDSLVCVSRWPQRQRFELYPRSLRQRLPKVKVPLVLVKPDADATLDLQAALEQVYEEGRYARRVKYDQRGEPLLSEDDQRWADECVRQFVSDNRPT